ncbi:MAG: DUF6273 domain-containing protein [Roseburia sp.]|nr:DUF6273 domain-containing protein [Roseburia sp.]MCM1277751.1 DUF6273 domain-containing protein [Robinsoniella sp.]
MLQNDETTLFVMMDKAIDCKDYINDVVARATWDGGFTWETSTIRNWLNDSFYDIAFSSSEQDAIVTQNVVNEDNPSSGTEGGNNTNDKIYLLSIGEVTNETYGFCSAYSTRSSSRWVQTSDYAYVRGTLKYSSSNGGNDGCDWWLRSPGGYSSTAADVDYHG